MRWKYNIQAGRQGMEEEKLRKIFFHPSHPFKTILVSYSFSKCPKSWWGELKRSSPLQSARICLFYFLHEGEREKGPAFLPSKFCFLWFDSLSPHCPSTPFHLRLIYIFLLPGTSWMILLSPIKPLWTKDFGGTRTRSSSSSFSNFHWVHFHRLRLG